MKTLLLIISLTIFTFNSLFAQWSWFPVYIDTDRDFESIFFTDANTGYATGWKYIGGVYFPRVIKTTNAGSSWSEQTWVPQRDSAGFGYRSVFFTDINTGFIAVANINNVNIGRILKTTNGGTNWSIISLPVDKHLAYVYFITSSTGYASGHQTILKTTDAGATWVNYNIGGGGYLFAIHFTDINTGYVVGNNGVIFKTTNGGTSWVQQNPTNINLWGVSFADANTGVAVGGPANNTQNIILRTTNAGSTWTSITYTYSTSLLYSVRFVNPTTGWITGSSSQILKTTNGGLNWYNQYSPVSNDFRRCFFLNALTGYVGGIDFSVTGRPCYILKTTDGGGIFLGIEPISNEVPSQFQLYQNYPNPFNPVTSIKFGLPKESFTKLVLFDVLGREVTTLVNEELKPGSYEVQWDASKYPSGVYFYKLITADFTDTKRMILIK